jgi:hypothetical protein
MPEPLNAAVRMDAMGIGSDAIVSPGLDLVDLPSRPLFAPDVTGPSSLQGTASLMAALLQQGRGHEASAPRG